MAARNVLPPAVAQDNLPIPDAQQDAQAPQQDVQAVPPQDVPQVVAADNAEVRPEPQAEV